MSGRAFVTGRPSPITYHASHSGRRDRALIARERSSRAGDAIQARAVVPQYLAPLLVLQRQAEELLYRLGECAVGVRVIARHNEIFRAHLVDDVDGRLFVDIERDVALALEIFARGHRQLELAARPELLPLVVEPPQPPVHPARRPLEERAPHPRMALAPPPARH